MSEAPGAQAVDFVFTQEILVVLDVAPWGDELIQKANQLDLWEPATMIAPHGGQVHQGERRNNTHVTVSKHQHAELGAYEDKIQHVFHSVSAFYRQLNPYVAIKKDTGFQLLRYEVGQHFRDHIDNIAGHPTWGQRQLSAVLYLNADYEGGCLHFPRQKKKIKPRAGSVVLFPSNFAYPHESQDVTSGTKYAVVTWFV